MKRTRWRRWRSRAGKRRAWVLREMARLILEPDPLFVRLSQMGYSDFSVVYE